MGKTRNQRKREVLEHIIASVVVMAVMLGISLLLFVMVGKALEHPAEQPITYEQHMASFQKDGAQ